MSKIPAYEAIRQYAVEAGPVDADVAAQLLKLSKIFEEAVTDGDGVVERDDHYRLTNALRDTLLLLPAQGGRFGEARGFLQKLQQGMWGAADVQKKSWAAYVPEVESERREPSIRSVGTPSVLGKGSHFATYVTTGTLERLFPGRFSRVPMNVGEGRDLDDRKDDYLFSDRPLRDNRDRANVTFGEIYSGIFQRELFLQGALSVGVSGEVDPVVSFRMPALLIGQKGLPIQSFAVRMPEFLGGSERQVEGIRLIWVLADALVKRGALERSALDAWRVRGDDPAVLREAAMDVGRLLSRISLRSADGFETSFSGDDWFSGGLRYALEHGVLALSRNRGFGQALPDYVMDGGLVQTPTGPVMLFFDAPVSELSVAKDSQVYPEKRYYIFNVDQLEFSFAQGVDQRKISAAPSPSPEPAAIPTLDAVDRMWDDAMAIVEGAQRDPSSRSFAADKLSEKLAGLEGGLAVQRGRLETTSEELFVADQRQGLLSHMFWNSPQVSDLEDKVMSLKEWVDRADDVKGMMRTSIRQLAAHDDELRPDGWRDALIRAKGDVGPKGDAPSAAWQRSVVALVKAQHRTTTKGHEAVVLASNYGEDLSHFEQATWFWQRWGWLDCITPWDNVANCESATGWMYRAGARKNEGLLATVRGWDETITMGEGMVDAELHDYLMASNPVHRLGGNYRTNFAAWEMMRPAYEMLEKTYRTARTAKKALESAEAAILARNVIKTQEPDETITVTHTSCTGSGAQQSCSTHTEEESNPAHFVWQMAYTAAIANAAFWSTKATDSVNELNAQRPLLQQELSRIGIVDHFKGAIDGDIGWWYGHWLSVAIWSYDSLQVDEIQRQVGQLVEQLHGISRVFAPEFHRYEGLVKNAREDLRDEMVKLP